MSHSVPNPDGGDIPFPNTPHAVFTKDAWADEWTPTKYVRCTRATHMAAPDVDQADLFYQWGEIKREDADDFATYDPKDWQNKYVQVRIAAKSDGTDKAREKNMKSIFTGIIVDDMNHRLGYTAGDQTMKAFGIAHILDRWFVNYAYALEPDDDDGSTVRIGYCPQFNEKGQWGRALLGNRSSTENPNATSSYDYVYLFSSKKDAPVWNAKQAIDHILGFAPFVDVMPVVLAGQTAALEVIEGVWDAKGKSVLGFINEIISRKNGLGYTIEINEGGGEDGGDLVEIRVFTLVDEDIALRDKVFPSNDVIQDFEFGTDFPTEHIIDNLSVRTTTVNSYNDFEVRGARVKVCFSISFGNSSMEAGWDVALQNKYDAADGATNANDAILADKAREAEKYQTVYRKFVIPADWDWQVGWGTAAGDPDNANDTVSNIAPITYPDGKVRFDEEDDDDEAFVHRFKSRYSKEFFRDLPFEKGVDYSKNVAGAPVNNNPTNAIPEYTPMFAWIYDDAHGRVHGPPMRDRPGNKPNWYYRLDKLTTGFVGQPKIHDGHIRAIDREMGIEIVAGHNHYLAAGHFDPVAHPTTNYPDFNYENIGATVFLESDAHLFVRKRFEQNIELVKTLVVNVSDCEYWYAHSDTTIDVVEGKLINIHGDNLVIRDDSYKLFAIASLLFIWFGKTRRAVTVPIKQLGFFVPVGAFITGLVFLDDQPEVNTIVTGVTWDLDNQATTIECGYDKLDAVGIVEGMFPGKSFAGRRGAAGRGFGGQAAKRGRR